jgi:hypothetical protein
MNLSRRQKDPETGKREKPNLAKEKNDAGIRLAFAEELRHRMSFEYMLLPADKVPERKLRLYDESGFFTFYRMMGTYEEHQDRTLFGIDDRRRGQNSPLLKSLKNMYERLWSSVVSDKMGKAG